MNGVIVKYRVYRKVFPVGQTIDQMRREIEDVWRLPTYAHVWQQEPVVVDHSEDEEDYGTGLSTPRRLFSEYTPKDGDVIEFHLPPGMSPLQQLQAGGGIVLQGVTPRA